MAAVLRGSRYLVGGCCKHVDFAFGKQNKWTLYTHRARLRAYYRSPSCYLKALCDTEILLSLEMFEEKFEFILRWFVFSSSSTNTNCRFKELHGLNYVLCVPGRLPELRDTRQSVSVTTVHNAEGWKMSACSRVLLYPDFIFKAHHVVSVTMNSVNSNICRKMEEA